ncbi:thiamine phosphate synthase [Methanococcus voltae]|uniref:Thiamine-phosphate synthase n=1 Tax=Methanococcus voltae (strain ATCC BAA-1334 / A3) TaxID=456320 RepID=D7DTM7_METV3|nr:thiamine phosphate synthase [Methanococcus voltae]MCS3901341.1 thiamine-phosphate pyrophosphorylase [Methanococcus voltae]
MRFDKKLKLYVITDSRFGKEVEQVKQALEGGATSIQLRLKDVSTRHFLDTAKDLRKLTRDYDALFFVNDRLDIAMASDADGIHVGMDDMPVEYVKEMAPELIIGSSAYNLEEANYGINAGADYLGVGAVYSTNTKLDARYLGVEGLKNISKSVNIPIVAIGGINHQNCEDVLNCDIQGLAVISAILNSNNIVNSSKEMRNIIDKYI